jgi:[NiFe] hydrogenase assembly HybE family chaperone
MTTNNSVSSRLESCFRKIEQEQMQGMPVLNPAMQVQAVGFVEWQGRQMGIMITPWFMSLIMLSCTDDDWDALPIGQAHEHEFPEKKFKFVLNEFEGIGRCQIHALHSPMSKFESHQAALDEASRILASMMVEVEPGEAEFEAERLRRFLDGDESALLKNDDETELDDSAPIPVKKAKTVSRRDLLRGGL